jgi:hypothetical protein
MLNMLIVAKCLTLPRGRCAYVIYFKPMLDRETLYLLANQK